MTKSGEYDPTVDAADTEAEVSGRTVTSPAWSLEGYQLKEVIGKGGMGEVVLARDTRMERDVALKRMLSEAPTPEAETRFLREAKIQAAIDHPAIVPVHELGRDAEGRPYFAMKRLTGTTLQARLAEGAALQPLLRAVVDVAMAIERAHSHGIVHRDLKPSNIMLGDYGEVYVLDWGIARVVASRPSIADLQIASPSGDGTKTGQMLGTPGYMAPEQMLGQDAVGPAADVYALGSILFEILSGEALHPRGQEAIPSTLDATEPEKVSPSRRRPERPVPPELDKLCKEALQMAPAARPSAREIADRIQSYLDGDRDVEQRRKLASIDLDAAKAALAAGDRARTMRLAGRAMTLDPSCLEAVELATSLVLSPVDEIPAEAAQQLAAEEVRLTRERSKRAMLPFLAFFAFLLFIPIIGVHDLGNLLFVTLVMVGQVAVAFVNWRVRKLPLAFYLLVQLVVVFAFSRLAGPFILTPVLAVGILMSFTAVPWANERMWVVVLWTTAAMGLPILAEDLGIVAETWRLLPEGILSIGNVFPHGSNVHRTVTIVANIVMVMLVGAFSLGIARDRRIAQRTLFVQRWHLEQLLPKAGARVR
jgi:tRNA A-37 threonylcarbamoyl transferase component Bud32